MSYNFHNLLHLSKDAKVYGHVDTFSAFKFENFMTTNKKKLRKKNKPLQQLSRRYTEIKAAEKIKCSQTKEYVNLKQSHFAGPLMNNDMKITHQYKCLNYGPFSIDSDSIRNNCVLYKDGCISIVLNIVECGKNNIYLIGKKCIPQGDFYEIPCNSSEYNIHEIFESSNELFSWKISELQAKFWKIPGKNKKSVVFPILHTNIT